MIKIRKVLVPIDFSEHSQLAADFAVELTEKFAAQMVLLHVYDVPTYVLPDGALLPAADVIANLMADVETRMDEALKRYEGSGITISLETRQGVPLAEIVRFAKEQDIDLIVMGTHGRTGIEHFLIGSVAEKVVRKASCPVLTVRPPGFGFRHPIDTEPSKE